jgi:hypothetical protein
MPALTRRSLGPDAAKLWLLLGSGAVASPFSFSRHIYERFEIWRLYGTIYPEHRKIFVYPVARVSPRLIGAGRAWALMLTGRIIDAVRESDLHHTVLDRVQRVVLP